MEQLAREPADVVITDVRLPGIDGLELCRRIRHQCTHEQTRVIALTGLNWRDVDLEHARAVGSDLVLFKPCLPDMLLDETKRLLEQSEQLRQASVELRARSHRATQRASELQARSTNLQDRSARRRRR